MQKTELSKIMRRAWQITRATGKAFAVALSKSWQLYRLTKRMRAGVVRFAYEKTDGTLRRALGTLQDTAATVKYYDIEADGWRSFKSENLITIY